MVALIVLLMVGVVALWWAGFAPFPTAPVLLASYQDAGYCNVQEDNWAKCTPGLDNPYPTGSTWTFRLFPNAEKTGYGEYNQWGVEGYNGCWDEGCSDIWHEQSVGQLRWKVYYDTGIPHFGLGRAKWVVILLPMSPKSMDGVFAKSAFTAYGACMYKKPPDTNTEWYKCQRIESGDPWKVGRIREP